MLKYTKQENKALEAIEEKYRPEIEATMSEVNKYDISTQTDEYCATSNKFHELNEKIMAEREVYFKRAELRGFNSFKGDVSQIVEALKNQILSFIYVSKVFAGVEIKSTEELEKDRAGMERGREEVRQAIIHNEKQMELHPDDEELRINTQELKEMIFTTLYDQIYSTEGLKNRINESFAIYLDYVLKTNSKAYADLQIYIDEAIARRGEVEPLAEDEEIDQTDTNFKFYEVDQYLKLPQGTHTNNLVHKLAKKKTEVKKDLNGNGSIIDNNFKLYIEGYDKLVNGANTSAVKLFDAFVMNCSKKQDALAKIPLKEYMDLRGLKDEKETRKQIKNDMEVLRTVKFEFKGTGKGKNDWLSLSLYGGRAGIYKGIIEFMFSKDFYSSIPENQFMFIPGEYFSTKDKYNPHTAYFIRRIAEHKRMNLGKTNENIIGVDTLINSSPTFPKYDTVGYQFTQKILEPFERDMDAMDSLKWSYTEEQLTSYNDFVNSSIVVTWVDYPDTCKFIQNKTQSIKEKDISKKAIKKEG